MPDERDESQAQPPRNDAAGEDAAAQPETPHEHDADSFSCPACNPAEHTEADEAAIQADPGTRSLSRALATSFLLLKIIVLLLAGLLLLESVTFVEEGNVGLVRRFGAYLRDDEGRIRVYKPEDGFVFVWPRPIEVFEEVSNKERAFEIGEAFWPKRKPAEAIENEGDGEVPSAESLHPGADGYNLTGDLNVIHSRWRVRYRVTDAAAYRLATAEGTDVEAALHEIASAAIFRNTAGMGVDAILYREAEALFRRIRADVRADMTDDEGRPRWGIEVTAVTNRNLVPPGKTRSAFDAVNGALSERKRLEDEARTKAEEILRRTQSAAQNILNDAKAYEADVAARAAGDARRLHDILDRFPDDPQGLRVFLQQYRYERLKEILDAARLYILREGQNWFVLGADTSRLIEPDAEEENE